MHDDRRQALVVEQVGLLALAGQQGGGDEREQHQDPRDPVGVGERGGGGVDFAGWIPPDRMPEFLSGAQIGLLPLIPDAANSEWMRCKSPTKLFEYMAMEIPAVASRYGEAESIVEDGREGFLASSRGEFARRLADLAGSPPLRREMGALARRRAEERYCHRVMGGALLEAVEFAAGRGDARPAPDIP